MIPSRFGLVAAALVLTTGCENKVPEPAPRPAVTASPAAAASSATIAASATPAIGSEELKKNDLKKGKGPEAKAGDTVKVHYTGRLLKTNVKFDSSRDAGDPFSFTLGKNEVIKGWDDGVLGMKVGGERQLTIGSRLAYGTKGSGKIPPNAALVFDIELLEITPAKAGAAQP